MAIDTQAVSIPATCTHTTRTTREVRLRTLEIRLIRALDHSHTRSHERMQERRLERVFYELCDLVQARSCDCERWT
jgi:hypothetical protein